MQKLKTDARGVAHHFVLAAVVILVATGGTYYLVKSKADSCTPAPVSSVSDPVSDPSSATSNPVSSVSSPASCTVTSSPVSAPAPVSTPTPTPTATDAASVTIGNVTNISTKGYVTPKVTIKNTGTEAITPKFLYLYSTGGTGVVTPASLSTGQSTTVNLPAFKPDALYTKTYKITVEDAVPAGAKNASFTITKSFVAIAPVIKSQTLVSQAVQVNVNKNIYKTIDQFEASNPGKPYELCATVKADRAAKYNAIQLSTGYNGLPGTINSKRIAITTSYTTHCIASTLPKTFYSKWPVAVSNASNVAIHVSNLTVKLR